MSSSSGVHYSAIHQVGEINSNYGVSDDATGYNYNYSASVITDREGIRYSVATVNGLPSFTSGIEDTNGNEITGTVDPEGGSVDGYTDTLGRSIPLFLRNSSTSTSNYTGCTGSQPTTGAYLWSLPGPNGDTAQFKVCYAFFTVSVSPPNCVTTSIPSCHGVNQVFGRMQSIVLPNGTAWTFAYDTTGGLSQITLPTGGTISHSWSFALPCNYPRQITVIIFTLCLRYPGPLIPMMGRVLTPGLMLSATRTAAATQTS